MKSGPEAAICDLKYFAGRANELHLLRDRVAELEELLGIGETEHWQLSKLGFSKSEAAVLGLILKRKGPASREFIFTALYGSALDCDQPGEQLIDVWISKINSKLERRLGFRIVNVRAYGWHLLEEHKATLREQLTDTQRPEGQ
jgi:hypothetical protein